MTSYNMGNIYSIVNHNRYCHCNLCCCSKQQISCMWRSRDDSSRVSCIPLVYSCKLSQHKSIHCPDTDILHHSCRPAPWGCNVCVVYTFHWNHNKSFCCMDNWEDSADRFHKYICHFCRTNIYIIFQSLFVHFHSFIIILQQMSLFIFFLFFSMHLTIIFVGLLKLFLLKTLIKWIHKSIDNIINLQVYLSL